MLLLTAGVAAADTKIVRMSHTDAFTMMGQTQPAQDEQSVTWMGDGRMRMDRGGSTFIVRPDLKQLLFVDHGTKTYRKVDLPIDMTKLMPPGMGEQMMQMMKFQATVTPSAETRPVEKWTARRFDVSLTSMMMNMKSTVWATKEVKLDISTYNDLHEQIVLMQPGMSAVINEMRKIEGFPVLTEGVVTMMGSEVKNSEKVTAVEEGLTAPAGTYDPPAGYTEQEFDFMKLQQSKE